MEKMQENIKSAELKIEDIPELPEEFLEEDIPSLEELIERSKAEMKKAKETVEQIKERCESHMETARKGMGASVKEVEGVRKKMDFEGREDKIMGKVKTLVADTEKRVKNWLGGKKKIGLKKESNEKNKIKEPFDPDEEYKKVKEITESNANVEEKQRALREYKKELMMQKEGIAEIQNSLRKAMEENPKIFIREMKQIVESRAGALRLTENQKKTLESYVETFHRRREAIQSAREKYPDAKELFKACFSYEPRGEVSIKEMPISLLFRCEDTDDYVETRKKVAELRDVKMSKKMIDSLATEDGVALTYSGIPELRNMLILENLPQVKDPEKFEKHEGQHHFYKILEQQKIRKDILFGVEAEKDERKKEEKLEDYLKFFREGLLEFGVKNEMLAFYKEGDDLASISIRFTRHGGAYDFYEEDQERLNSALREVRFNSDKLKELKKKIFRQEYDKIIKRAVDTLMILEVQGKSREEIIELLAEKPLEQWPNLVRHIKQVRRGK